MRLLIELESLQDASYKLVHNYIIQGFLYNLLKDTEFAWLHSYSGFKFFNFSNVFPVEDFRVGKLYNFIVSSPNKKLIETFYKKLNELKNTNIKLGSLEFLLKNIKKFDLDLNFPWRTATPIVLVKGKEAILSDGFTNFKVFLKNVKILEELGFKKEKIKINGEIKEIKPEDLKYLDKDRFRVTKIIDVYFSFRRGDLLFEWINALKEQSIMKYNSFTSSEIDFEDYLFDEFKFWKEVSIRVRLKEKGDVIYIGSLWYILDINRRLNNSERKFYKFLMDCGLGNLNSLGFGFVNPLK